MLIICKAHRQSEQILSSEVNLYRYTQNEYVGISEHYIGTQSFGTQLKKH